jgi:hypothetical protein
MVHLVARSILLLLILLHETTAFSKTRSCVNFAPNGHLQTYLLSNSLRTSRTTNATPLSTTTTSTTSLNVISSFTKTGVASNEAFCALRDRLLHGTTTFSQTLQQSLNLPSISVSSASVTSLISLVRNYWWLTPMSLAIIPLYCAIFKGTCAAMPDWWNVVPMEHIAAADNAQWIIGHFLASNMSYFISGLYLMLKRFPLLRKSRTRGIKIRMTKFSMLGAWIFLAGAVSTIFHSVQALGPYPLAQSLCYLDHAVAVSAFCYFVETCGCPSRRVLSVGGASLITLCVTSPGYTLLHSSWHYLSAATATLWALEGYGRLLPTKKDVSQQQPR